MIRRKHLPWRPGGRAWGAGKDKKRLTFEITKCSVTAEAALCFQNGKSVAKKVVIRADRSK